MEMDCVWKAEKEGVSKTAQLLCQEGTESLAPRLVDEVPSMACKATGDFGDEPGDPVCTPQRILKKKRGTVFAKANVAPRVGMGHSQWGWG
eukprot:6212031-Pleurochrysis_carterae.AAC.9